MSTSSIRLPGTRAKKRVRLPTTEASKEKAKHDEEAHKWCEAKYDRLHQAHVSNTTPPPADPNPSTSSNNEEVLNNAGPGDLNNHDHNNNLIDHGEDHEPTEEGTNARNIGQFVAGRNYTSRRVKEEWAWGRNIRQMFICWMRCSNITSDWGHKELWCQDHFKDGMCYCPESDKSLRKVDMLDLCTREQKTIQFCSCTPDQVRLISQGYLGGSPTHPQTAFSLRLLRTYHTLWKHKPIGVQPFALAIDEILDACNPVILVPGTNEPRRWRRPLSCAVYAYRQLLKMREDLVSEALDLSPSEALASICPRCFGPGDRSKRDAEPDLIVCMDANFQQRRHVAASRESEDLPPQMPSLFLPEEQVQQWADRAAARASAEETTDPCTAQHTAAADTRTGHTWRACEETGLMVIACRHDQCISYINIVRSGEKSYFAHALLASLINRTQEPEKPPQRIAVLYDIGCTLEKGIKRHNLFTTERSHGQLKFGTSAFHALVHRWSCQLEYNPRLNIGWGLSDGEGSERIWSFNAPLVPQLRFATRQNRVDALHLRTGHKNNLGVINAACLMSNKFDEVIELKSKAQGQLLAIQQTHGHTMEYCSLQWERQRTCQLELMAITNLQDLESRLGRLITLEENFREAHSRLAYLRSQRRRTLTEAEHAELAELPGSMVVFESTIDELVSELGGEDFRNMPEVKDPCARARFRVRLAKQNLYEAKVAVVEHQKKWDQPGIGTTNQERYKSMMVKKEKTLKQKWTTYELHVNQFHTRFPDEERLQLPSLQEITRLSLDDTFWNVGHLTHPNELWASDVPTQQGIHAFRTFRSCDEEVRRIAREVRNVVLESLRMEKKLDDLKEASATPWIAGFPHGTRPIQMVQKGGMLSEKAWNESQEVLKSVHKSLSLTHCRRWMVWDKYIRLLLDKTEPYCDQPQEPNSILKACWVALVARNRNTWATLLSSVPYVAEGIDEEDMEELRFPVADDEEIYQGDRVDVLHDVGLEWVMA